MSIGTIFDIREFSINDGPGTRLTVFLKGCPLSCAWCHNPEGMSVEPIMNIQTGRSVGRNIGADELARIIQGYTDFFENSGGGVTFSGGEPTMQSEFLLEVISNIPYIHKLLDTSGYCDSEIFADIISHIDMIFFDIKLADENSHIKHTGVSNRLIRTNLKTAASSGKQLVIRIPMIPQITDTKENLEGIHNMIIGECPINTEINLIPYNYLAEGKYAAYDINYPLKGWYRKNNNMTIDAFAEKMRSYGYRVENYV